MATKKYIPTEGEMLLIQAFVKYHGEKKINIMTDRVIKGMPLQKIAKKYKVSVNYVHLIESELLTIIRKAMEYEWQRRLAEYNRVKPL